MCNFHIFWWAISGLLHNADFTQRANPPLLHPLGGTYTITSTSRLPPRPLGSRPKTENYAPMNSSEHRKLSPISTALYRQLLVTSGGAFPARRGKQSVLHLLFRLLKARAHDTHWTLLTSFWLLFPQLLCLSCTLAIYEYFPSSPKHIYLSTHVVFIVSKRMYSISVAWASWKFLLRFTEKHYINQVLFLSVF